MEPEQEKSWQAEKDAARKFLCRSTKIAEVTHLDDGKDDVYLRLSFPALVELLAGYGVERMCNAVKNVFAPLSNERGDQ